MEMYETTSGKQVTGTVTRRYERTMSVREPDGTSHLCWLIGKPKEKHEWRTSNKTDNKTAKEDVKKRLTKCRVFSPDGSFEDFESIKRVAEVFGVSRSVINYSLANDGKQIKKGALKDYRVVRIS